MDALAAAAAAVAPPAPARRRLTTEQRWTCIVLYTHGWKRAAIARDIGCDWHTVTSVIARWRSTADVRSGTRTGRPRCTSEEEDTNIALAARIEVFTSPRQVCRKLNMDVSPRTLDRRMQEADLFGRVARHKRDYSPAELQKRLSFANGYGGWSIEQWKQALFADEKCFYGKGFCGRIWVRREKGEALNPNYTIHKQAHPVKVNVWACFASNGAGFMYIFNENMDSKLYSKILNENLAASADLVLPEGMQRYFLMDNASTHKSDLAKKVIHEASCITLDFPPYSPDLNPIENLWAILARRVERHTCETVEELQDVIADEWGKIEPKVLRKLARSMPTRCQRVIEAKGWHTKY